MPHDDFEGEVVWLQVTKYAPALMMLLGLIWLDAPYALAIAVALVFAVLGFFALYKNVRIVIAAATIVVAVFWSFASVEIKHMLLGPLGTSIRLDNKHSAPRYLL